MTAFIEQCNCRGTAPAGLSSANHVLRPRIIGELLKDRSAPRFLVAPRGYGKTSVAFEYAKVIFGFEHVFWIRGDSPCFLRDLDNGTLYSQIFASDENAGLIVFDDIPYMDDGRLLLFGEFLESISERGCEFLGVCLPTHLATVRASRYSQIVDASSLCLDDDEIAYEASRGNSRATKLKAGRPVRECSRSAAWMWDDDAAKAILSGIQDESLTSALRAAIFGILLMGDGAYGDLEPFCDPSDMRDDLLYLSECFPYLGISSEDESFSPIPVSCEDLKAKGSFRIAAVSGAAYFRDCEDPGMRVAGILLERTGNARACEFAMTFMTKRKAAHWLASSGWRLVADIDVLPFISACISSRAEGKGHKPYMDVQCAWAMLRLGDIDASRRLAARAMRSKDADWSVRCASMMLRCAGIAVDPDDCEAAGIDACRALASADGVQASAPMSEAPFEWDDLIECSLLQLRACGVPKNEENRGSEMQGSSSAASCWTEYSMVLSECLGSGKASRMLSAMVSIAWCLSQIDGSEESSSEALSMLKEPIERAAQAVCQHMDLSGGERWMPSGIWHDCVVSLEKVMDAHPYMFDTRLTTDAVSRMRSYAMDLAVQDSDLKRLRADRDEAAMTSISTLPDSPRNLKVTVPFAEKQSAKVPDLEVRLFGGFEAGLAGTDRGDRALSRAKSKITLAILMLNRCREVSKERITETLWPESDFESRQRNFYVVWSDLKRALSTDSGCPYLIRSQTGYRLERRFVRSDLDEFDSLCHDLMFGDDDMHAWRSMYDKASKDFAEDLLPNLKGNEFVDNMRSRYRMQLVDGLVAASERMGSRGEHRGAIWFAREALRRDGTREDAYIALMKAQIGSDQRGAALETYFDCRRHLSEHLGIDPSSKIMDLYRSIIEIEEEF